MGRGEAVGRIFDLDSNDRFSGCFLELVVVEDLDGLSGSNSVVVSAMAWDMCEGLEWHSLVVFSVAVHLG